jgi:hypothetical protein
MCFISGHLSSEIGYGYHILQEKANLLYRFWCQQKPNVQRQLHIIPYTNVTNHEHSQLSVSPIIEGRMSLKHTRRKKCISEHWLNKFQFHVAKTSDPDGLLDTDTGVQ